MQPDFDCFKARIGSTLYALGVWRAGAKYRAGDALYETRCSRDYRDRRRHSGSYRENLSPGHRSGSNPLKYATKFYHAVRRLSMTLLTLSTQSRNVPFATSHLRVRVNLPVPVKRRR